MSGAQKVRTSSGADWTPGRQIQAKAPAVLLRDTPEDRERLADAIHAADGGAFTANQHTALRIMDALRHD